MSLITFNGSCWPTAKEFLDRTDASIVLAQEVKLDGDAKAEAEQWCLRHRWQPFITPCCRPAAGNPTAGTGIFVRSHIGAAPIIGPGATSKHPGSIMDGWAMAVHVDVGMKGGLIVASVYLECGQGIGCETRNWQRLLRIGETMQHFGRPFILGGDWNVGAAELGQSGWPGSMQARLQTVGNYELGTCRSPQGNWSCIDYFVVSRHLQEAVLHLHTVGSEPPKPHLPVRLTLAAHPRQYRERALKKVKQFPLCNPPPGPAPRPPCWSTMAATANLTGQQRIDALHTFVVNGVETELISIYGLEGADADAHRGRAGDPKFVWRHAGGDPKVGDCPASDRAGRVWRLTQRRLEDIAWALKKRQQERLEKALGLIDRDMAELFVEGHCNLGRRWRWLLCTWGEAFVQREVEWLAKACSKEADTAEEKHAADRRRSFSQWAKMASGNGGGAAHAFCKVPREWKRELVPGGVHPGGRVGQSSNPQEIADAELRKWQLGPWQAKEMHAEQLPPWPVIARLQPILGEEVRKAAKSYSWRTGLSLEQMHPKHLSFLSDEALFAIAYFMYSAEVAGLWASPMQFFAFFLLHKPTGGFRTIGLLATFYRVWAKVRMPLVRSWGLSVPRQFFAAGVGKSTEEAVGRLLMAAEGMKSDEETAGIILDIDKCYENVQHDRLIRAGIQHKFPLAILRLCICMYRAARTVSWNGTFSNFVYSGQTLVAGCSVALWLLQLLMVTPLDEYVFDLPPEVRTPEIYVDDGSVYIVGRKGKVEDITVSAARKLFQAFEDGAGLPVSRTKGRVTASCPKLANRIAFRLRRMGCKATKVMAVLGVDTAAGRGGIHGHQRVRMGAMMKRSLRLKRLKGVGAEISNVAQAAVVPGVSHGTRVTGMTPAVLHTLRQTMKIALPDRAKSASTTMQYMLSAKTNRDPTYAACGAPYRFWARQAFKGLEETRLTMQQAWVRQVPKLGAASRPWQHVAGPAGAITMVMQKLKWTASSAFHVRTADGWNLDLRVVPPHTVEKLVKKSVEETLWREWANAPSGKAEAFTREEKGYWMAEPRRLCRGAGRDWSALDAACLGSILSGSQWPQARLFAAGFVDTATCQGCSGWHLGTVAHRSWTCKLLTEERAQGISREIVQEALAALSLDPNHPLWTRGLMAKSMLPTLTPISEDSARWFRNTTEGTFTGHTYTDGSMRARWWWPESERAGWGVASTDGDRILRAGAYGPLPGPDQCVPRAELYAICEALRLAVLPIHLHTDHLAIVTGIESGEAKTTAAEHPNADLWKAFWRSIADHGGMSHQLTVQWCPGHDDGDGRDAIGNRWADILAKKGGAVHELPEASIEEAKLLHKKHWQILRWIGKAAAYHERPGYPPNRTPKSEWPARTKEERRKLSIERASSQPSEIAGDQRQMHLRYPQGSLQMHSQTKIGNRLTVKAKQRKTHADVEAEERERCVVQHAEVAAGMQVDEAAQDAPAQCIHCGARRRLQFVGGKRCRADCGCWDERRAKRRRLTFKQPDPAGLFSNNPINVPDDAVSREDANGHLLMITDNVTWCFRCGAFSTVRIHGLGSTCAGAPGEGQLYRLKRLKSNRHPLSNLVFSGSAKRLRTS